MERGETLNKLAEKYLGDQKSPDQKKQFNFNKPVIDIYAYVQSKEAAFVFQNPVILESFFYRLNAVSSDAQVHRGYYELYQDERLIIRKEVTIQASESKKWEKADHPVHGMSFFNKIVFSHGFEIDVIKFRMFVDVA